jgi:predicted dehydrogenase
MVGGGQGAFIGAVHRIAARLDGEFALVAGALSSDPGGPRRRPPNSGSIPARSYGSFAEMAKAEAARPDGIEAVAIVTPNHMHFPAAKAFLEAGIHVICDKPLTSTLADAKKLAALAAKSGRLFVLTHNYTGYPMVRQAREMVQAGKLGDIRVVQAEYPQDWLTTKVEDTGAEAGGWRTDPKQSGAGGATGDIGTHAYNLARFVSGLELDSCRPI